MESICSVLVWPFCPNTPERALSVLSPALTATAAACCPAPSRSIHVWPHGKQSTQAQSHVNRLLLTGTQRKGFSERREKN
ncbi:hypothetical protein BDZ91DRAFT_722927, partial [Kalaharituber pfeilii]